MDTLEQRPPMSAVSRTINERRDIVEETLVPGASVARVGRRHDVNANQVFYWRKLYPKGGWGCGCLRFYLHGQKWGDDPTLMSGTMEIKLPRGTLRIAEYAF